jgi:hypothetical protein
MDKVCWEEEGSIVDGMAMKELATEAADASPRTINHKISNETQFEDRQINIPIIL